MIVAAVLTFTGLQFFFIFSVTFIIS